METAVGVNGKQTFYGVGRPVLDIQFRITDFWQTEDSVGFTSGGEQYSIPYQGPEVRGGEKYTASRALDGFLGLPGATTTLGGGVSNTICHLGRRVRDFDIPVALRAVDLAMPDPVLEAQYRSLGIDHLSPVTAFSAISSFHSSTTAWTSSVRRSMPPCKPPARLALPSSRTSPGFPCALRGPPRLCRTRRGASASGFEGIQ